ncbi:glycosyltransferase family 9 protein [Desulfovibrio inopinatus]|uniref:glycosyltransferase family 9 protein n=1 Tax=Desulfovibrio inopinatus TaxID=102109 RepID=UPI00040A8A68|nr:glycosyltransferase family 9 protein [Desulfovibrio inopinatus]
MSMPHRPILVLQMLRMGDLVLSFPLFLWLSRMYPDHPIWVVAEPTFYKGLMPLSPHVTYFPWTATDQLKQHHYHLIVNLSHRIEAAKLCGMLEADEKIGPLEEKGGVHRIRGDWQLYRASIVQNNRHNRYHYADLNALDIIPQRIIAATRWSRPQRQVPSNRRFRVGVFIGASQPEKRPDIQFSASFIDALDKRGIHTVLFGGPGEKELGLSIQKATSARLVNMCGRLTLAELFKVGMEMDLFVTPDTGPMHVAAWAGIPVFNLSMGPVNPWETGPYQPGHYVLRAAVSCLGCWSCSVDGAFCRPHFQPEITASLIRRLLATDRHSIRFRSPGLKLFCSTRDTSGLYDLSPVGLPEDEASLRERIAQFWKAWFAEIFQVTTPVSSHVIFCDLAETHPRLMPVWRRQLLHLGALIRNGVATNASPPHNAFWKEFIPILRPLSGYIQLILENNDYSKDAWRKTLHLYAQLADVVHV